MHKLNLFLLSAALLIALNSCSKNEKYKEGLSPKNYASIIMNSAFQLGKLKDLSAVKPLLTNILDPDTSTVKTFKGMTVCYCKLEALRKISGVNPPSKIIQSGVDTMAVNFYLQWALQKGLIKSINEVDIHYY